MTTILKKTIAPFFLLILMASCRNQSKPEIAEVTSQPLPIPQDEIYEELKPKAQTYTWTGKGDTILVGKKGTKVFLPENCLDVKSNDPVDIELTEYYSLSEFVAGNLTTECGDQILETGGMINLKVTQNGTELSLKKDKEFAVLFPKERESNKKMGTFYGSLNEDDQVVWEADKSKPKQIVDTIYSVNPDSGNKLIPRRKLALHSAYRTRSIGNQLVEWMLKDTNVLVYDYVIQNIDLTDSMLEYLWENNVGVRFEFNLKANGKIVDLKQTDFSNQACDSIFQKFLMELPCIDMSKMPNTRNRSNSLTYSLGFGVFVYYGHYDKEYKKKFELKYKTLKDEVVQKIDKDELNYYVLSATKFGWINCDRFWNTPEEKIDFVVDAGKIKDLNLKLVFADIKSIMAATKDGDKFIFRNIPVGREVKLVGIGNDGEVTKLGIGRTKVSKRIYQLDAFNSFKLAELEEQLNSI